MQSTQNNVEVFDQFLRLGEVMNITSLSRSSIYKRIGEGSFPAPVSIGGRAKRWLKTDIESWISQQIRMSRFGLENKEAV